jgi:hypothetical protein
MATKLLAPTLVAGALLASAVTARADGIAPAAATPLQREQAQSRFHRGKELMDHGHYGEALVEFRASHDIVASPNTRLEIARDLRAAGQLVAAYAEFGRAAVEAKELTSEDNRYRRAYEAAAAERAEVEPRLAFVSLTVAHAADATTVTIGGEEVRRGAWGEPAPLAAGSASIVVRTPGKERIERTVTVAAGDRVSVTLDADSAAEGGALAPTPPPPAEEPDRTRGALRTGAYVSAGVGVAGLAAFAVFGLMARSTYDGLQKACGNSPCASDHSSDISAGKTQSTVANVGLVAGLVGAAATLTLFVVSLPKKAPANAAIVITPGGIGVAGSL